MSGQPPTGAGVDAGLLAPVWAGPSAADLLTDEAYVRAMAEVEVALLRAQCHLGIVPQWVIPVVAAAADTALDVTALAAAARGAANPVVPFVEALTNQVRAVDPAAAEYVHRGGTSQDILDTATMLIAGRVLRVVRADLDAIVVASAALAADHRLTPMAGRTLTQHAVPITFGVKAAGWCNSVLDARERLDAVLATGLPVQLGGAAGTLAAYAEYAALAGVPPTDSPLSLVEPFARELGMTAPVVPWHSLRAPVAGIGAVTSLVTGTLGKVAIDVQGMARTEVGEVAEPARAGRGVSSAMPQKRNPVLATLIVSAARQVPAHAMLLHQCLLAEDERSAGGWHAEWYPMRECLRLTAGASATARELLGGLEVRADRMRHNLTLTGGAVVAERINAVLSQVLDRGEVKKLLGRIARSAVRQGRDFGDVLVDDPELQTASVQATVAEAGGWEQLLDPSRYLGASAEIVGVVLRRCGVAVVGAGGDAATRADDGAVAGVLRSRPA
ncbi:adenylosuccinate lyase family protein [Solwaraspora sp. WMMD791]|uniref:class-II fumarase/aspartase family protein n=1 Tax=Solwaraspora sp. WMMD791 TaxID=3016086 RepID=UPI00249B165B|nr:adenylosuccinate lyase family protein [Solwaraspora sp. WMMD791]WFE30107.1 adenylosuccinate lyase family protein [Solwaraspora sp. WMMD791]